MGFFLETLLGGLMTGMLYSLVALGFVLIFKASGVFNFAQGAMVLFAALAMARFSEWIPAKVGIDNLIASYDTNGDGFLSKEELLADVKLDQRPLPVVLSDPKSVDWDRLAGRAGVAAPLLRRLFPM